MKFVLDKHWSDELAKLPETGMGYQVIDITLKSGFMFRDVKVLNTKEIYFEHVSKMPFTNNDIKDIIIKSL